MIILSYDTVRWFLAFISHFLASTIRRKLQGTRNMRDRTKRIYLKERSMPNKTGNVLKNLLNERWWFKTQIQRRLSIFWSSPMFDLVFSGSFFKIRILYGVQMKYLLVWWGYFEIEKKEIWHTLWRVLSKKTVMKTYCLDVLHK